MAEQSTSSRKVNSKEEISNYYFSSHSASDLKPIQIRTPSNIKGTYQEWLHRTSWHRSGVKYMSADINPVLDGLGQQEQFFCKYQSRAFYILKPFKKDKVINFKEKYATSPQQALVFFHSLQTKRQRMSVPFNAVWL